MIWLKALRQGQLFEPTASSGPAAMVLAISRNLSCIPRRSPCPGRYPLPLAYGGLSTFRNQQYPPRRSPCPTCYPRPLASAFLSHLSPHKKSRKLRTLPANSHTNQNPHTQAKRSPIYFIFANLSTALVKFSIVLSASPCSIPSLTQCWICPSSTTCPTLCKADFAALI